MLPAARSTLPEVPDRTWRSEPMTKSRHDLAADIRRIRTSLEMTMKEFGERIGVSEATVSRWESAKHLAERESIRKIDLLCRSSGLGPSRLDKYAELGERERMEAAVSGVRETHRIGPHLVQLLSDGVLVVNEVIRIDSGAATWQHDRP
jgi:transcriptional regulator with XRE-family HTH domain